MTLRLPVVLDERSLLHEPLFGVWLGTHEEQNEIPERVTRIRDTLVAAGAPLVAATDHGLEPLVALHHPGLVAWLAEAWDSWLEAGLVRDPATDRVVPYNFPTAGLLAGLPLREPVARWARAGRWAFDTMTVIGPGTWEAVLGAAHSALTAADLVAGGERAAYALARPPGHHVTREAYGGSCYLNNTGLAAERLRAHGAERVAIVDVDAHHGNGQQALFWHREDIWTGSVHVDPGAGSFPHWVGFAGEDGGVPGSNLNLPLAHGTGDDEWLAAVARLAERASEADAVVIALGVDASVHDDASSLTVTETGFRRAGEILGALDRPTVVVQEGGYDLVHVGQLVATFLEALAD